MHATSRDHAFGRRTVDDIARREKPCQSLSTADRHAYLAPVVIFRLMHVQHCGSTHQFLQHWFTSSSMPTYHARSITVRLASMPLAETTTSEVVLKKGEVAKRQSEAAEEKLMHSFLLDEERVLFPGDPDGYELNWLGNAPFMQVCAVAGFTESSAPYASPQKSSTPQDRGPQALALHVNLSAKAFMSGFSGKTHLKIDVLFNGQLSACSLVHTNDIRSGAKSLHQVFAGFRVDFLAERPWVILPPYTNADGGERRFRKTITSTQRWEQICASLQIEAKERGTNKDGEAPPSAVFMDALSTMQMPEIVKTMHKPGGRKFGVVDVIITAGMGSKLTTGASYLKTPQRLKDPNYTFRDETIPKNKTSTAKSNHARSAGCRSSQVEVLDLNASTAAEEDGDTLQERPRKRRAPSPSAMRSQCTSYNPGPQSLFSGMEIPYLPPPRRPTLIHDLSPVAGRVSLRCPSPEHSSDGHKEPLPSKDGHQASGKKCQISDLQGYSSDASRIFQEFHSPLLNGQPSALHASLTHSTPVSMPFSTPRVRHEVFDDPPFVTSTSESSPMMHTFGIYNSTLTGSLLTGGTMSPTHATTPGPSTPCVAPTALIHPTLSHWSTPPNALTTPYYRHTYPPQQAPLELYSFRPTPYVPPNGMPSLLPKMPPLFGHSRPAQYATPMRPLSAMFQSPGVLPPTAMFTVTSKPRRSTSPTKGSGLIDPNASRPSALINRLVITGLGGRPIVDHYWKVAQRIVVHHGRTDKSFTGYQEGTPPAFGKRRARSRVRKQSASCTSTFRANSPPKANKESQPHVAEPSMYGDRRDSAQDGQISQYIRVKLPYLKKHQGPSNEVLPNNPYIEIPDQVGAFASASKLKSIITSAMRPTLVHTSTSASSAQSTILQRRTGSRNAWPGIQGPKATTFLLDDPEEVLREAARTRRSKSPTKPATTLSVPPIRWPTQVDSLTNQAIPGDSSPLSSVPSSPPPEAISEATQTAGPAIDKNTQLDGSSELTTLSTSSRKIQAQSLTKSSFCAPKFRHQGPAAPQTSILPDSKKRKAAPRSYTKLPRSPGRLMTVDNPALNDDCVIAFAESKDKDAERGVLRQVKGEKQGVFKEEYVVLAVRFFIPGD